MSPEQVSKLHSYTGRLSILRVVLTQSAGFIRPMSGPGVKSDNFHQFQILIFSFCCTQKVTNFFMFVLTGASFQMDDASVDFRK